MSAFYASKGSKDKNCGFLGCVPHSSFYQRFDKLSVSEGQGVGMAGEGGGWEGGLNVTTPHHTTLVQHRTTPFATPLTTTPLTTPHHTLHHTTPLTTLHSQIEDLGAMVVADSPDLRPSYNMLTKV